jgi:hypothetical protein
MKSKIRSISALLLLITAIGFPSLVVCAQEPDPNEVIDRQRGGLKAPSSPSLPNQIQLLGRRTSRLLEFLQNEVVKHFIDWAQRMAYILAGTFILFSFLREWRENGGGRGENFYWWFARLAVCVGMFGTGIPLINEMIDVGKDIAVGQSMNSVPFRFYDRMQANFSESYAKIAENQFVVKVNGTDYRVPSMDGTSMVLGVIADQAGTARDFNNNLQNSTWLLPRLFAWMGWSRNIIEGGEVWLMFLAFILLTGAKIFAPFAIVLAIDRKQAHISYAYLYGVIVLTLIWPTVSYFIRGLAYMFGNAAMALGDSAPAYVWNQATMQAFRSAASQPVYTVLFACFAMTVIGGCLWLSPVIAFQIGKGRLYEGISNAASSIAGTVIGTVADWYSSNIASKLHQEATQIQAQAGYEANVKLAGGERQAADLAVKANREMTKGQIEGSQIRELTGLYANMNSQIGLAKAQERYGNASVKAQAGLSKELTGISAGRERKENEINANLQNQYNLAQYDAEMLGITGSSISRIGGGGGSSAGSIIGALTGNLPTLIGSGVQMYGANVKSDKIQDAIWAAAWDRKENINAYVENFGKQQDEYVKQMTGANSQLASDQSGVAKRWAEQSAAGINRSTTIQLEALDRSTGMQLDANQTRFDSQTQAADITRRGAFDAANLHQAAEVARSLGSNIAHGIKSEMVLRY